MNILRFVAKVFGNQTTDWPKQLREAKAADDADGTDDATTDPDSAPTGTPDPDAVANSQRSQRRR